MALRPVAILWPYRHHVTYTVYVTCRLYEDIGTPGQLTTEIRATARGNAECVTLQSPALARCSPSIQLGTVNGQALAALF